MDIGVKSPLDSQHAALLLGDTFGVKDNGETQRITAPLHPSASLSAQERLRYQTLPSSGGKKNPHFLSHLLWLLAKSLEAISAWISRLSRLFTFIYMQIKSQTLSKVFGV